MGADLAYMGTRFISTVESGANPEHKQMILDAQSKDIVYTPAISGVPANFLRSSLEQNGYKDEELKAAFLKGGKLKPADKEAASWNKVWSAGQGVGNINDTPTTHDLIERLKKEYAAAQQKLVAKFNAPKKQGNGPKP